MTDIEKAYQYFVTAIPESESQAKAYFWARKALQPKNLSNEPLTLEELREMGGRPYWHIGLHKESTPPHWNILDPFIAKHIEDYKYGENWLAYRQPPEGESYVNV